MAVNAGPTILLDIVGARGESVLEVTRRLALGGAAANDTDVEAAEALATYMAGLGVDANLAAAVAAKVDAEAASAAAAAYANVTFSNIAAAKAITFTPTLEGLVINVACYATEGDGGGGRFQIVTALPETADDGIWFNTNTVGYYLIRRFDGPLKGEYYGLTATVGDKTQNTDRLNAALATASVLGLPYHHPKGQVTPLDYQVTIPQNPIIDMQGGQWNFEDAAGPFDNFVNVLCEGSFTDLAGLVDEVTTGASILQLVGTPECQVDDVLFISSTAVWNPSKSSYNKGEAVRVAKVDGNNVYLTTPLRDSYVAAQTSIGRLNQNNVDIVGLNVVGDSIGGNSAVILKHFGPKSRLVAPSAHTPSGGLGAASLNIYRGFGGVIIDPNVTRLGETSGSSYALVFTNSQGCRVIGGRGDSIWHACAVGGDDQLYNIVNRDIVVDGGEWLHDPNSPHRVHAVDFHGNCENCSYLNLSRADGVSIGGRRNRVGGLTNIKAGSYYGLATSAILFSEILSLEHDIEETVKIEGRGFSSTSYGLAFDGNTSGGGLASYVEGGTLRFYADCVWRYEGGGATTQYAFRVQNLAATPLDMDIDLSRAKFRFAGNDGTLAGGISVSGTVTYPFRNITLPKKPSTCFVDARYFGFLDGKNIEMDCFGLGTTANVQVNTSGENAVVDFDGAVGLGGSAEFLKIANGASITTIVSAVGVKVKNGSGYTKVANFDSAGVLMSGAGNYQGLGATLERFDIVRHIPGTNDGSITHATVSSYQAATFA